MLVPDIEERLREVMPGRGRQKTAEAIEGASNCFFLDPSLPEAAKKVRRLNFTVPRAWQRYADAHVTDGQLGASLIRLHAQCTLLNLTVDD